MRSKNGGMEGFGRARIFAWAAAGGLWLALGGCGEGRWAEIPAGEGVAAFEMGRREVTCGEWRAFLKDSGYAWAGTCDGGAEAAASGVSAADAEAYAEWLGRKEGRTVRLPTGTEWEHAARGGLKGAPWPWGWGGNPRELAQWGTEREAERTGGFPANGYGLKDVAGNVWEWTARDGSEPEGARWARGGAWCEPLEESLRVDRRQKFPEGYRGRDVGFRVLREAKR